MAEFVEVMKKRDEICIYCRTCEECPLCRFNNHYGIGCSSFVRYYPQEAEKIIMDWQKPFDWSKVKVDTPILVRESEDKAWKKRHFAKYEDGKVFAWNSGMTSWSACNAYCTYELECAKLAEEGDLNGQ